jgi:hypothetical protein
MNSLHSTHTRKKFRILSIWIKRKRAIVGLECKICINIATQMACFDMDGAILIGRYDIAITLSRLSKIDNVAA